MALQLRRDDTPARQEGFTLVEMVVTVTVIGILFLAVAVMLDSGLRALSVAKARARGNDIATAGIEDLQRYSFNNLALCYAPSGTAPAGLETTVTLAVCPSETPQTREQHVSFEDPCNDPGGTIPRREYKCTRNNIEYSVKRYIAWADAVRTTKRLAVFVEWTDAAGLHRVSQQSSLRAPDQSAITGLAPPKFSSAAPPVVTSPPTYPSPMSELPVTLTATGTLSSTLTFKATTENLSRPANTTLQTYIPPHGANAILDISVATGTGFPTYNGFPVMIDNEAFTVLAGAGTDSWRVLAGGSAEHLAGVPVKFVGDQVFATLQTIGSNNFPQSTTVSLSSNDGTNWAASLDSSSSYRFGSGSQYVSYGILRAADGKRTSAFAATRLEFCQTDTSCNAGDRPLIQVMSIEAQPVIGYVPLTSGGELQNDLTLKARTTNVSDIDTVAVNFLTQAGSITVTLTRDPAGQACPATTNTVSGLTCDWIGTLPKDRGYRFAPGLQRFYFSALQVLDSDPATIDNGSTAAAQSAELEFRQ